MSGEPNPESEFIIGIPTGHHAYSTFYTNFFRWIAGHSVMPVFAESNRVDVNRSEIIATALKLKKNIIFLDSDALPQTNYTDVCKMLLEDFKTYDIVVAPVRGVPGNILIQPLTGDFKLPQRQADFKPFEIKAGSFTFAGISYNLISKLKPLSQYGLVDGRTIPLYVAYSNLTSEEYAFCHKAKKQYKSKVACDPRIKVLHYKEIPLEGMISVEEQEERRKKQAEAMKAKGIPDNTQLKL